ncbi:cytochrome c oxidase assembly protein CtaG/Cox11-domain-containing protein [Xylariaceae sp. FL0804]|nr:cytochrome c oxidase assembly protein CtaG/Cox11-domain-containing protein [Xylariaceae sp. FL0804]
MSSSLLPRIPWRPLLQTSAPQCRMLARARPTLPRAPRRPVSNSSAETQYQQQQQRYADHTAYLARRAEYYKHRNRTTIFYAMSLILGTVAFSYGSVPMYKMICQTTGWGGTPIKAPGFGTDDPETIAERVVPVDGVGRIRVKFVSSVSDVLPWRFVPQQREVVVRPGETALAFFTATNRSEDDIIGVATYSVTPAQVAPYFSKIQCFCFEEQRLAAGETVDMPVFFYLDPDLLNDFNMRGVNDVILSYTFFKAKYDNNGKFRNFPTVTT